MAFRITGLSPASFAPLWDLDDDALAARHIRRVVADRDRGFPCRISLDDARSGETLLLLPYVHHDVAGPYRASGPIFVRQTATSPARFEDDIPPAFLRRLLSVRAYDAAGWMLEAEVMEGTELQAWITRAFQNERVEYLHVHNARPGCFAARVERA